MRASENGSRGVRIAAAGAALVVSVVVSLRLVAEADSVDARIDHGIRSAFAMVSHEPGEGFIGQIALLGVAPGDKASPRMTMWVYGGDASPESIETIPETRETATRLWYSQDKTGSQALYEEDTASDGSIPHGGYSVVLGGELSESIVECGTGMIQRNVAFEDLTEVERNGVISNLDEQDKDRSIVYGDPVERVVDDSSLDLASGMTYSVLTVSSVQRLQWEMKAAPTDRAESETSDRDAVSYLGYFAYFSCSLKARALTATQPWGERIEFPPITTAARLGGSPENFHLSSSYSFFREKWTPGYQLSSTYPEDTTVTENWDGRRGWELKADNWESTPEAVSFAHVDQTAVSFRANTSSQMRELFIFLAGVSVSFAVTMTLITTRLISPHILRLYGRSLSSARSIGRRLASAGRSILRRLS